VRLSSSDFGGCGFPEEWLFWLTLVFTAVFMLSMVMAMVLVEDDFFKEKRFFPVIFYYFNRSAFSQIGNLFRYLSLASALIAGASVGGLLFLDYVGQLDCGVIK
jgi:hypothetical protein